MNSIERIQESQQLAEHNKNPQVEGIHLLHSFLNSNNSIVPSIVRKVLKPESFELFKEKTDISLQSLPKLSYEAQLNISKEFSDILTQSQQISDKMKDSFTTEEHLLLALLESKSFKNIFWYLDNELNYKIILEEILKLRKWQSVTSNTAENNYESLKKYTIDLVDLASKGKIDPVIWREEEIQRTIQILSRRTKKQPCFNLRALSLKNSNCRMNS